jgi:hypothetical protein
MYPFTPFFLPQIKLSPQIIPSLILHTLSSQVADYHIELIRMSLRRVPRASRPLNEDFKANMQFSQKTDPLPTVQSQVPLAQIPQSHKAPTRLNPKISRNSPTTVELSSSGTGGSRAISHKRQASRSVSGVPQILPRSASPRWSVSSSHLETAGIFRGGWTTRRSGKPSSRRSRLVARVLKPYKVCRLRLLKPYKTCRPKTSQPALRNISEPNEPYHCAGLSERPLIRREQFIPNEKTSNASEIILSGRQPPSSCMTQPGYIPNIILTSESGLETSATETSPGLKMGAKPSSPKAPQNLSPSWQPAVHDQRKQKTIRRDQLHENSYVWTVHESVSKQHQLILQEWKRAYDEQKAIVKKQRADLDKNSAEIRKLEGEIAFLRATVNSYHERTEKEVADNQKPKEGDPENSTGNGTPRKDPDELFLPQTPLPKPRQQILRKPVNQQREQRKQGPVFELSSARSHEVLKQRDEPVQASSAPKVTLRGSSLIPFCLPGLGDHFLASNEEVSPISPSSSLRSAVDSHISNESRSTKSDENGVPSLTTDSGDESDTETEDSSLAEGSLRTGRYQIGRPYAAVFSFSERKKFGIKQKCTFLSGFEFEKQTSLGIEWNF